MSGATKCATLAITKTKAAEIEAVEAAAPTGSDETAASILALRSQVAFGDLWRECCTMAGAELGLSKLCADRIVQTQVRLPHLDVIATGVPTKSGSFTQRVQQELKQIVPGSKPRPIRHDQVRTLGSH